uniref:Uncharacterized protein n=1 Tax=Moniliophthora roreri TaxID=221103 RepID=A0A0W0F1W7_MONRR
MAGPCHSANIDIIHRTDTIANIIDNLRLTGKGISFDFPIASPNGSDDHIGVVTIQTDDDFDVSFERFDEVVESRDGVFGSGPGPMWYLATENDFTAKDYLISFSKIKRYYGVK